MVWVRDAVGFPMIVDPACLPGVTACIVHIEQSRQLVDGRWNLMCKGIVPADIEECWVEDGTGNLFMAKVRPRNSVTEESAATESNDLVGEGEQVLRPGAGATISQRTEYILTQMHLLGVASRALHRTDATRFSWEAAHAAGSLLYVTGNDTMQTLLDVASTEERLTRLCDLYHEAFQRKWSVPTLIASGLHRWGPMIGGVMVLLWAARRS